MSGKEKLTNNDTSLTPFDTALNNFTPTLNDKTADSVLRRLGRRVLKNIMRSREWMGDPDSIKMLELTKIAIEKAKLTTAEKREYEKLARKTMDSPNFYKIDTAYPILAFLGGIITMLAIVAVLTSFGLGAGTPLALATGLLHTLGITLLPTDIIIKVVTILTTLVTLTATTIGTYKIFYHDAINMAPVLFLEAVSQRVDRHAAQSAHSDSPRLTQSIIVVPPSSLTMSRANGHSEEVKAPAPSMAVNRLPEMINHDMIKLGLNNQKNIFLLKKIHYTAKKTYFLHQILNAIDENDPAAQEKFNTAIGKFQKTPRILELKRGHQISKNLLSAFIDEQQTYHSGLFSILLTTELSPQINEEKNDTPAQKIDKALMELYDEIHFIRSNSDVSPQQEDLLCNVAGKISNELKLLRSHKILHADAIRLIKLTLTGLENRGLDETQQKEYLDTVQAIENYRSSGRLFTLAIGFLSALALTTIILMAFNIIPATYFGLTIASLFLSKTTTMAAACMSALIGSYCTAIYESALSLPQTGMFAYKINGEKLPGVDNKTHSANPPSSYSYDY